MFRVERRGFGGLVFTPDVTVLEESESKRPYPIRQAFQRVQQGRSVVIGYDDEGHAHLYRRLRQALRHHDVVFWWLAVRSEATREVIPHLHPTTSPFLQQPDLQ